MNDMETARLYDNMAEEYDDIKDLWYAWLFSRLHFLIVQFLKKNSTKPGLRCIDIGSGTGFQSILLALCGHHVTGIDISPELVRVAGAKRVFDYTSRDLFESPFGFVHAYSNRIRALSALMRGDAPLQEPEYHVASATRLPFRENSFDLVNCCGSTLSAIEDYDTALNEITRVLRPGGIILLEVENRYNLDLIWPVLDFAVAGKIGYDQELKESLSNLFRNPRSHVKIDFPFSTHSGEVLMPIRLFSSISLGRQLRLRNIRIEDRNSIHCVTNLLPSVSLDEANPSSFLTKAFALLQRIESVTSSLPLFRSLGCSSVLFGHKG